MPRLAGFVGRPRIASQRSRCKTQSAYSRTSYEKGTIPLRLIFCCAALAHGWAPSGGFALPWFVGWTLTHQAD